MTRTHDDKPFFITEEIAKAMEAAGYGFEPPAHASTMRLSDVLATVSDDVLATWPGAIAERERAHRRQTRLP